MEAIADRRSVARLRWVFCLFLIPWLGFGVTESFACTVTRLSIGDRLLIARNHDWPTGDGLVMVNPSGVAKEAITPVNPATWTSTYGSVSFAQFGRGIPFAGMNEAGLTIDLLRLPIAEFPAASRDKPNVNAVQWVQYQLDTAASVVEVVDSLEHVNPAPFLAMIERVHYYVSDASGDVAIIEFIGGKPMVRHAGNGADASLKQLMCALANSSFEQSVAAESRGEDTNGSEKRYREALAASRKPARLDPADDPVEYAMSVLDRLAQPNLTQWSLVYEPAERRITFKTAQTPTLRYLDLKDIDFTPADPLNPDASTRCVDIHAEHAGDVSGHLRPFAMEDNLRIVNHAFDAMIPAGFVRMSVKQIVLDYGQTLKAPASQ